MYDIKDIITGAKEPQKVILELNRLYHRKLRGRTGIKVMDEDWDNLIILDACRYDLFVEMNHIDGELTSVISSDSSTSGFLKYNFGDNYFPDTVYITANPQVQRHDIGRRFYDCIRLWETDWDDELHTVLPDSVTESAITAQNEYQNKRKIIHYIQPHYPFIGETGKNIQHRSVTGDGIMETEQSGVSIWDKLERGDVDKDTVWKAYRENLQLVLQSIDTLIEDLHGKTVITSDHGNVFGKFNVYGHPGSVYLQDLVTVPWLECSSYSGRTEIQSGEIESTDSISGDVSERLSDLGYK